ncbi:MAG: glycerol-3-phosphate dehydrogenase/oxidase, partial [Gallionellaceae bacterium]|nr:glycerol-3-phosphate dehydrogenase/oxidase [Gallionellaceae bacterium]
MKRDFSALAGNKFDLLVCGGGIYGAWTAYDAALRGLKVALVEQNDWACGTSSASSKLIHGGLRYLETYDFKLVRKALKERGMLLKAAPHRVWPLRFGVPVYADSRVGRLKLKAGLWLYDLMARSFGAETGHRYWGQANFAKKFPALAGERLKGGFTYLDAQTDDARLVLELVSGAISAGAVCVNQCELLEAPAEDTTAKDRLTGETVRVQARTVVHTFGQWLTQKEESKGWIRLSKGVHLILPSLLNGEALLLTAKSDGRVFFMIPWYGLTLVGTTDTDYQGDVACVVVEDADVQYLLREVNHYLNTQLTKLDVIGSYAGLRAMRQSEAGKPSAVSRDWALKSDGKGYFYSVGGKLTSAREDASLIVDA